MKLNIAKLKIKAKSLAEEAHIIRTYERKFNGMDKWSLQNHRKTTVRDEARATLLTLGLLLGMPYRQMEATVHDPHYFLYKIRPRIVIMAKRYGYKTDMAVDAWLDGNAESQVENYLKSPFEDKAA